MKRKVLSLILVLVLVVGVIPVNFAQNLNPGEELRKLGVIVGDEQGDLLEDKSLTRAEMMVLLARLNGVENQAKNYSTPSSFSDDNDHWAENYIAYAESKGWTNGISPSEFGPEMQLTEAQTAEFMLRVLGYHSIETNQWRVAIRDAARLGIESDEPGGMHVRRNAFKMIYSTLMTPKINSDVPLGIELGLMEKDEVVYEDVVLEKASAMSSNVLKVELDQDYSAPVMVHSSMFKVIDEDDNNIDIDMVEFAGWDSKNYTVLVHLEENLISGDLYQIESKNMVSFGGRSNDTTKPEVVDVTSTDYNEITVEFDEPIVLSTVQAEFNEKYGSKTKLEIMDMYYDEEDVIVFKTNAQKAATLYEAEIWGAKDFSGNTMDRDDTNTFVGKKKPTDELQVSDVVAEDYNMVIVKFNNNMKVDPNTVVTDNFTIRERYGSKNVIDIYDAEVITDADDYVKATEANEKSAVVLTTESLKGATLYELTAKDLKSIYETNLDTDKDSDTFVGVAKLDKDMTYTVSSTSNMEVKLVFSAKVNINTLDISDFVIKERYGDKKMLEVTDIDVDEDDHKIVYLTTKDQRQATLYQITLNNIQDIYGNGLDTSSDRNVKTFVGKAVADAIEEITSITRKSQTEIVVKFDQNVGNNATNVSYYFIDNKIGYPENVKKGDNSNEVELTIPKTSEGTLYKLTVKKGIENADGIMSTKDISKSFAGLGEATGMPVIEAVVTLDNQTIKVFFDRMVEDDAIDGQIWNSDNNSLMNDALQVSVNNDNDVSDSGDFDLVDFSAYAYEDSDNESALIVRIDQPKFRQSVLSNTSVFKLVGNSALVDDEDDANIVQFAYNNNDPEKPYLEAAMMINYKVVRLYFSEPVKIGNIGLIKIYNNSGMNSLVTQGIRAVTRDDMMFDVSLQDGITSLTNDKGYVVFNDGDVKDISGKINSNDQNNKLSGYSEIEFGLNSKMPEEIDDVFAVMTNARTIKVYFPEDMDESDVTSIANYDIVTADSSGASSIGSDIFYDRAIYDDKTQTATLYLKNKIQSIANIDRYFLALDGDIRNVLRNNTIDNEYSSISGSNISGEGMIFEFAADRDEADPPELLSARVSSDRMTLTIKFNEDVYFADADSESKTFAVSEDAAGDLTNGLTSTELLNALKITAQFYDQSSEGSVQATDIDSIMMKDYDNESEIKIVFDKELKANTVGTITTEDASPSKIFNRANIAAEVDSDASEISFAVPSL